MVTLLELQYLAQRVWPATKITSARQEKDGGWSIDLRSQNIETHHRIDGNGHPTCHQECTEREAAEKQSTKWLVTLVPMRRGNRRRAGKARTEVIDTAEHPAFGDTPDQRRWATFDSSPLSVEQAIEAYYAHTAGKEGEIMKVIDVREAREGSEVSMARSRESGM